MTIVNVSDPTSPYLEGSCRTPGEDWDVVVSGDRALVADGSGGLRIYDVNDPTEPEEIAFYEGRDARGIDVRGSTAYVATSRGLDIYDCSDVMEIKEQQPEIVNGFILSPPYPNPFNASTRLTYNIPTPGLVTLKLFDIAGRQVRVLEDDYRTVGRYEYALDAGDLAAGVYVVRLEGGMKVVSGKIVLMK